MSDHKTTFFQSALRDHIRRSVGFHAPPHERYAVVRRANAPFVIEMLDSKAVLNEDDGEFVTSAWLRRYDADHGIQVGDTVILGTHPDGTLVAKDIVTLKDVTKGVRTDITDTKSSILTVDYVPTDHGHVLGFLDVHDKDSNKVGVSLVYEEVSLHDAWETNFQPFVNGRIIGGYQLFDPETDALIGWVPVYEDIGGVPGWMP